VVIARTWRGWTRARDAAEYERYLLATGFAEYRATPGNKGVYLTRRDRGDRAEFFLISLWESWDAVRTFAGDDPEQAVFYPEDDRFLVGRETTVDHYEVFATG
jgi:heme-degrading monooxygenase HmoA